MFKIIDKNNSIGDIVIEAESSLRIYTTDTPNLFSPSSFYYWVLHLWQNEESQKNAAKQAISNLAVNNLLQSVDQTYLTNSLKKLGQGQDLCITLLFSQGKIEPKTLFPPGPALLKKALHSGDRITVLACIELLRTTGDPISETIIEEVFNNLPVINGSWNTLIERLKIPEEFEKLTYMFKHYPQQRSSITNGLSFEKPWDFIDLMQFYKKGIKSSFIADSAEDFLKNSTNLKTLFTNLMTIEGGEEAIMTLYQFASQETTEKFSEILLEVYESIIESGNINAIKTLYRYASTDTKRQLTYKLLIIAEREYIKLENLKAGKTALINEKARLKQLNREQDPQVLIKQDELIGKQKERLQNLRSFIFDECKPEITKMSHPRQITIFKHVYGLKLAEFKDEKAFMEKIIGSCSVNDPHDFNLLIELYDKGILKQQIEAKFKELLRKPEAYIAKQLKKLPQDRQGIFLKIASNIKKS